MDAGAVYLHKCSRKVQQPFSLSWPYSPQNRWSTVIYFTVISFLYSNFDFFNFDFNFQTKCRISTDFFHIYYFLTSFEIIIIIIIVIERAWDKQWAISLSSHLLVTLSEPYHRARLLAASAAQSGDWLSAIPISACGLRLTNDAVRVAVGMRLGTELGQVHKCTCGASLDTRGTYAFSCRHNPGRAQRHHYVNDLIWHSLTRAGIPFVKEP